MTFVADDDEGLPGVVDALAMALKDARERPISTLTTSCPSDEVRRFRGGCDQAILGSSFESFWMRRHPRGCFKQAAERVREWQKRQLSNGQNI